MSEQVIRSFKTDFAQLCSQNSQSRAVLDSRTGRVWTYGALNEAAEGFAALYGRHGISSGDRIFSLLPNSIEQFTAFLAAMSFGADFCPISPFSTLSETRRFLDLSGCKFGLIPDQTTADLKDELSKVVPSLLPVLLDGDLTRYFGSDAGSAAMPDRSGKLFLFTSGTTSSPKAIVLDRDRLWSSAVAWVNFHTFLDSSARFYNILPMSYLGGLFNLGLIPLACGGSVVLSNVFSAVSALHFWREVETYSINTLWFAPTILRSLAPLHRGGSGAYSQQVRAAFIGMANTSTAEKEKFEDLFGFPLLENFALSETTFITSERLDDRRPRGHASVGRVLPWVDIRLSESESEIEVRTPFLFDGYLESPHQVNRQLSGDGFFSTGDLGVLLEDKSLVLRGRCKDIIKKGGYLVLLRELEEIAENVPGVNEASAIGVTHEFYGESALVCVTVSSGSDAVSVLELIKKTLTSSVSKFKWPSEILAVESLPKTESGKTQRWILKSWIESRKGIVASLKV